MKRRFSACQHWFDFLQFKLQFAALKESLRSKAHYKFPRLPILFGEKHEVLVDPPAAAFSSPEMKEDVHGVRRLRRALLSSSLIRFHHDATLSPISIAGSKAEKAIIYCLF